MLEPNVLIVDDEPEVLDLLSRTLTDHHFRCQAASDIPQAKMLLERENLDLVVSDLALGDGSGLDLLKFVRCSRPSLPVIMVTGFPSVHVAEEALRLGAFDLIEKPFNIHMLVEVVNEAAATRRRQITSLRETLAVLGKPAAFIDRQRRVTVVNPLWQQLMGNHLPDEGRGVNEYVAAESSITVTDLLAGTGSADTACAEVAMATAEGSRRMNVSVVPLRERRDQPGGFILALERIVVPAAEAAADASIDPLTGCLTHRGFLEALEKLRRRAIRKSNPVGILMVDIDDFAAVNQAHGYDIGDQILQGVASEIRRVVREEDLVGRYGADQFVIALCETNTDEALAAASRLTASLTPSGYESSLPEPASVTIGVAPCPAGYTAASRELIEQAAAAVAWTRKHGLGPVALYGEGMSRSCGRPGMNEEEIERLTQEFAAANEQLKATYIESARALVAAVEAKDPYTRRHSDLVARYASAIAQAMHLPEPYRQSIYYAATLHDLGKIGIPDDILTKPGPLATDEFDLVRQHPIIGANIVSHVSCMRREIPLIQHHHENWDGSGYPAGLKATGIPLGARVLRVADSLDTMLNRRSYKDAKSWNDALDEIREGRATLYDPRVVDALIDVAEHNADALRKPVEKTT